MFSPPCMGATELASQFLMTGRSVPIRTTLWQRRSKQPPISRPRAFSPSVRDLLGSCDIKLNYRAPMLRTMCKRSSATNVDQYALAVQGNISCRAQDCLLSHCSRRCQRDRLSQTGSATGVRGGDGVAGSPTPDRPQDWQAPHTGCSSPSPSSPAHNPALAAAPAPGAAVSWPRGVEERRRAGGRWLTPRPGLPPAATSRPRAIPIDPSVSPLPPDSPVSRQAGACHCIRPPDVARWRPPAQLPLPPSCAPAAVHWPTPPPPDCGPHEHGRQGRKSSRAPHCTACRAFVRGDGEEGGGGAAPSSGGEGGGGPERTPPPPPAAASAVGPGGGDGSPGRRRLMSDRVGCGGGDGCLAWGGWARDWESTNYPVRPRRRTGRYHVTADGTGSWLTRRRLPQDWLIAVCGERVVPPAEAPTRAWLVFVCST